jgi:hypothetical protein
MNLHSHLVKSMIRSKTLEGSLQLLKPETVRICGLVSLHYVLMIHYCGE